MPTFDSLYQLLQIQAQTYGDKSAILAPGRAALSYAGLLAQAISVNATLLELGLKRNSRVAIVLPNGPEMATAFVSIAASVTSAPLNAAYGASEFDFYLSDLDAAALVILQGMESPAREIARKRNISVIELVPDLSVVGQFTLHDTTANPVPAGFAEPDDVAIILHTSGTTSRPKMVPLTQHNICASAANIVTALALTDTDRCLNIMPLFHIHGLIGAVLASLNAGASVVCTEGFLAPLFYQWLDEFKPTWYTAVPTMHQAILARAAANREIISRSPLRFIRSASAPLPPQVMHDLESAFNAPVVEAYGMTEASHQIAVNPLPPRQRKPGSVGIAAGTEIAIADVNGTLLPAGETGEIVLRGPNVTVGYANNPTANESAFTNGWFRTGDQGHLDQDGYLFITGRLKELINRGGQKISPREIDEVLLAHPDIAQAVTFAVPHATLGEDVAAAIVLRAKPGPSEAQIREFASQSLAYYKVPHQIVFLDDLPKGATGKLQRIGLADKLGIAAINDTAPHDAATPASFVAPRTPLEETIARIWSAVLRVSPISINDNFLDLGGDSMLATQVVSRLRESGWTEVSLVSFLETPTIADMAEKLVRLESEKLPADDLAALLDDLEMLSDEEAQDLLSRDA